MFPTDSGGKIRTLNILRHLARWHDITYLCNVLPAEEEHLEKMEAIGLKTIAIPWNESARNSFGFYRDLALNTLSRYPFNVNKDYDSRLREKARSLIEENNFDLLICDFVQMARNCIGFEAIPKLLFEHNVEAQIFERHSKQDRGVIRRAYMWLQWKKMHWFEKMAGTQFDTVVAVSEQDRATYEREYEWQHAQVIDTAVDTEYFAPQQVDEVDYRCVFIGSMDWLPNEDGVRYFVREVWPIIRARYPDATFQVVGRNPPPSILALDGKSGVEVTGSVPDVRPFVAHSQVVVIPLLVGGGTRLKVFEAMAMGKPIVSTSLGVEGLKVIHGENALLADTNSAFADEVIRLFESPKLRENIVEKALDMVQSCYSAEVVARQFEAICISAMEACQSE